MGNRKQERRITEEAKQRFMDSLREDEKSRATIEKYRRDLGKLEEYLQGAALDKEKLIAYKQHLIDCGSYKTASINSFLVVANHFCQAMGWHELRVKTLKQQREVFRPREQHLNRQEYRRLIQTAERLNNHRLALILQTIGGTGIRISELRFIDVAAVKSGMAYIRCKGKNRKILLPCQLQRLLEKYIRERGITEGAVFCSAKGNPMDRSNIWREMKSLSKAAGIDEKKVFPHNLRHLFAVCFYQLEKDIVKLADILGHSSVETTRIYMKTTGEEHRRMLDRMGMIVYAT